MYVSHTTKQWLIINLLIVLSLIYLAFCLLNTCKQHVSVLTKLNIKINILALTWHMLWEAHSRVLTNLRSVNSKANLVCRSLSKLPTEWECEICGRDQRWSLERPPKRANTQSPTCQRWAAEFVCACLWVWFAVARCEEGFKLVPLVASTVFLNIEYV